MGCRERQIPHASIQNDTHTLTPPWRWRGWILDSLCTVPLCLTWTDPQDRLRRTGGENDEWRQIIMSSDSGNDLWTLHKIWTPTVTQTDLGQTAFAHNTFLFFFRVLRCQMVADWRTEPRNEGYKLKTITVMNLIVIANLVNKPCLSLTCCLSLNLPHHVWITRPKMWESLHRTAFAYRSKYCPLITPKTVNWVWTSAERISWLINYLTDRKQIDNNFANRLIKKWRSLVPASQMWGFIAVLCFISLLMDHYLTFYRLNY